MKTHMTITKFNWLCDARPHAGQIVVLLDQSETWGVENEPHDPGKPFGVYMGGNKILVIRDEEVSQ